MRSHTYCIASLWRPYSIATALGLLISEYELYIVILLEIPTGRWHGHLLIVAVRSAVGFHHTKLIY
jgi:hypothetical protein